MNTFSLFFSAATIIPGRTAGALVAVVLSVLLGLLFSGLINKAVKRAFPELAEAGNNPLKSLCGLTLILSILTGLQGALLVLYPEMSGMPAQWLILTFMALILSWLLSSLTDGIISLIIERQKEVQGEDGPSFLSVAAFFIKSVIWLGAFMAIAGAIGFPWGAFLGVTGIAVVGIALFMGNLLSNPVGAFAIFLDKPFVRGDTIKAGEFEGVVEDVGFSCTRLRTDDDVQVFIPNRLLIAEGCRNLSRIRRMKVDLTVPVAPDSHQDRVDKAMEWIRKVIQTHPDTSKGSIQVFITQITGGSMDIAVEFYIETVKKDKFNQARQELLRSIYKAVYDAGIKLV